MELEAHDKAFPTTIFSMGIMADYQLLIQPLEVVIKNPEVISANDEARSKALKLLRAASLAIETPFETLQRIAYSVSQLRYIPRGSSYAEIAIATSTRFGLYCSRPWNSSIHCR